MNGARRIKVLCQRLHRSLYPAVSRRTMTQNAEFVAARYAPFQHNPTSCNISTRKYLWIATEFIRFRLIIAKMWKFEIAECPRHTETQSWLLHTLKSNMAVLGDWKHTFDIRNHKRTEYSDTSANEDFSRCFRTRLTNVLVDARANIKQQT